MKINRTTIFTSLIIVSALIITSGLLGSDIFDNVYRVKGEEFTYTLEFSKNKNKPILESDTGNTGSYFVDTDLGNPIQFAFYNVDQSETGFITLPAGSFFHNPYLVDLPNFNQVSGITKMTVISDEASSLSLDYGYVDDYGVPFASLSITSGVEIDIPSASFFNLKNNGDTKVDITSISITYSCISSSKSQGLNLDGVTFTLNNDGTGYIVSDCDTSKSGDVILPSIYNGLLVLGIGQDAFRDCTSLTSIVIPSSVTSVGWHAFDGCTSLTIYCEASSISSGWNPYWNYSNRPVVRNYQGINGVSKDGLKYAVTLDSNGYKCIAITGYLGDSTDIVLSIINVGGEELPVKEICANAFSGCTSLTSIYLPSSVTSIGSYAFAGCTSLTSINIPNSITSIRESGFYNCTSLTSIDIPSSVTWIDDDAFSGCTSLTSIVIPDSVIHIGNWVFRDCTSLTSIYLPSSVTSISDYLFYNCSSLTSINIPNSVIYIRYGAFLNCTSLTSIYLPSSVTSIGEYAFSDCTSLTSINIPDSVIYIGYGAFLNCTSLTPIDIPNSVTSIGDSAFSGCDSLTSITIPNSVTSIGRSTFFGCDSLTSIYLPSSITSIGEYAFYYCDSLTSINIPSRVTSIGNYAFAYCSKLAFIYIPSSVTSIGSYAFSSCSSLTVYCEASSEPSGWVSDWNSSDCAVKWGYTYEQYLQAIS